MKIYIEDSSHHIAACDGKWWEKGFHTYSFTYAHGALEKRAEFDLLAIRDEDGPALDTASIAADVTAVLPDGEEVAARLFHWWLPASPKTGSAHGTGLLVALDDAGALAYAETRYKMRKDFP